MKLLLHACCGPCSLEPVRLLREAGIQPTIFYANSNIAPAKEYEHRLRTLQDWARTQQLPVLEGTYDPAAWEATAGRLGDAALAEAFALAVDPQKRQARCRACYRLRFEETAQVAKAQDFDTLGTTLSVSPYQYTDIIRQELERAAAHAGLATHFQDFRPYYDEATRRSREAGMYRQNYCGCRISDAEAAAERAERKQQRAAERAAEREAHADELAEAERQRQEKKQERQAYANQQARKRAILKQLREQQRQERQEPGE